MITLDLHRFPVLTTERLVLRQLRGSDAERMFAMRSDAAVMRHVNRPMATSIADATALIERINTNIAANEAVHWALTRKGEDTFIGLIGFWRIVKEHHCAELGYTLMQEAWGQGYASEAIDTVVNFGFGTMGLHRVEAITRPANTASMRVLEKNGFTREALRREDIFWNGSFHDSVHYGRLAP
ncbi:MAG: GNAT family N-acetyltransferase [Flavobacteriales bacterium]|nr:GNAT family N-acetyltransferase [Flavobacteriales bacterium]